jgi:hypothetical protein
MGRPGRYNLRVPFKMRKTGGTAEQRLDLIILNKILKVKFIFNYFYKAQGGKKINLARRERI